MTKGQFIYLVKTYLEGSDGGTGGSSKWHLGDIERYCEMAFANTVEQLYRQAVQYHDWMHIDPLAEVFMTVSVTKDTNRSEYVVKLPVQVLQLPENGGVREVWTGKEPGQRFHLSPTGMTSVYDEIERYDGGVGGATCYVEGDTIRIECKANSDLQDVNIRLIKALSAYEEDEEMPTVFGKDGVVMQQVLQMMQGILPSDDVNDMSSKKIVQHG